MKTLLYNPIFINPQAYYVFPRLTRYLQPDNESTSEPANYIGTIEVKVIAYGDTTLKRTYTNTDSIDLSEFKNTWIRISLFTKVGSCVLGEWKIGNMESDLPYIDPEVLASLKAVVIVGNKTNNDSDRAIVKNLVDPDNPFVISNAAYTEGSGYADKDSPYYGAFVTDGIDDLITSTKTVQEMGITDEVTVVSMIHQIDLNSTYTIATTNYIENSNSREHVRSDVYNYGKTGIYGYSASLINNTKSDIKNILGDEADYYVKSTNSLQTIFDAKFSVVGRISELTEASQVAWYWTIIANKVLTTDQINQVIAYFNLDRTLNPDILCNTIKQGITNENHAEFGDKLIDFSGNGRDIQLNNLAWKGDSGIGKYNFSNINIIASNRFEGAVTTNKCHFTKKLTNTTNNFCDLIVISPNEPIKFKVSGLSDGRKLFVANKSGSGSNYNFDNGEHEVSLSFSEGVGQNNPFGVTGDIGDIDVTVEFIPSHAGALCLDGVDDFGQFVGDLGLKDYTVAVDRAYVEAKGTQVPIISNVVDASVNTPFLMEHLGLNKILAPHSFGTYTRLAELNINRFISYQSTYKYNGSDIIKGTSTNTGSGLTIGRIGGVASQYGKICLWSLMLFPYSMSEFLIERQLKKHKLGTLYPDMVEWRPIIKSNVEYASISYLLRIPGQGTVTPVIGQYYPILSTDTSLVVYVATNGVDEVANLTINGQEPTRSSIHVDGRFKFEFPFNNSPQKINITIDEYIRYEDIVQPYPSLFTLIDYDTEEVYSWGSKLKVGARFKGNVVNLLPNMYEWQGDVLYNGEVLNWGIKPGVVAKEMVFSWNMPFKYLIDNNEPKVILSPRLLRIPNSSYKILGYIPDISGHGNNGVIHNSAYAEGSGVNEDGSYQFDGVDDFVAIPTLSSGGKQVLMKVNLPRLNNIIYDQRKETNTYTFAILTTPSQIAYDQRNSERITYIDGILNTNIIAEQLMGVTHNIVVINSKANLDNTRSPILGRDINGNNWSRMRIYDFMLFDDISTDDKIKELNEYVGIEAKVELPPYYWDAYGKTNLDEDKATIQQRGVAVGDYDLTNTNFAYDKMSGYGGYSFKSFNDSQDWNIRGDGTGVEIVSRDGYSITIKKLIQNLDWQISNNEYRYPTILDKELPFKCISNKRVGLIWQLKYKTEGATSDTAVTLINQQLTPNVPLEINLPYKTQDELTELGAVSTSVYYLLYFSNTTLEIGEEYTVEMLPLYPNGLVYDGITDYSENVNIPVFTDFTAIMKRKWLKNQGCPLIKGSKVYEGGNGNALLLEWDKAYNFVFYKRTDIMEGELPDNISFITPTNYNGNVITRGSEQDTNGICIAGDGNAGFANMVFYKLILYPKTIPLLQINFLKNLMERDEIIDLNNLIFIQE